jgi:peptidoglycan-associated lipoprotein
MRSSYSVVAVLLITALLAVAPACKKKGAEVTPEPPQPVERTPTPQPPPPPNDVQPDYPTEPPAEEPTRSEIVEELNRKLRTIYFDFDSSELSSTARSTLSQNAEVLKAYPDHGVIVEGHCDERGTIEYNLALGERRASSVRDYLVGLGVDRSRVRIITYGEERPADPGHTEANWSKNRRAAFKAE